jgi:ribosome recycling factor
MLSEMNKRMEKSVEALVRELASLRTGRASLAILDSIRVDYYGNPTPLDQVATLSIPEPRLIVIQPWDVSQIQAIEKALLSSDVGLNPSNDGKLIRIAIPQLTEERRKEIVKIAKRYAEDSKVSIRNVRRDSNEEAKKKEKDKELSQDELKKTLGDIQEATDSIIKRVDSILSRKEADIMEV